MTEESVMKEMEEIRQAIICGVDVYDQKYSVKARKIILISKGFGINIDSADGVKAANAKQGTVSLAL